MDPSVDGPGRPQTSSPGESYPARIFISYAPEDESHRQRLVKHLAPLRREGHIEAWYDRLITPGSDRRSETRRLLSRANLTLLLVSVDFIDSDECFEVEMTQALARHDAGDARAIPILVRPVDYAGTPLGRLPLLPRNGNPISAWPDPDAAWFDVARSIRQLVDPRLDPPALIGAATTIEFTVTLNGTWNGDAGGVGTILEELRRISGDGALVLKAVHAGSIVLVLDGSLAAFLRLRALFDAGTWRVLAGYPVRSVQMNSAMANEGPKQSSGTDRVLPRSEALALLLEAEALARIVSPGARPPETDMLRAALARMPSPTLVDFLHEATASLVAQVPVLAARHAELAARTAVRGPLDGDDRFLAGALAAIRAQLDAVAVVVAAARQRKRGAGPASDDGSLLLDLPELLRFWGVDRE